MNEYKQFAIDVTGGSCQVVADSEQQVREFVLQNCRDGVEITSLKEVEIPPYVKYRLEQGDITPFFVSKIGAEGDKVIMSGPF